MGGVVTATCLQRYAGYFFNGGEQSVTNIREPQEQEAPLLVEQGNNKLILDNTLWNSLEQDVEQVTSDIVDVMNTKHWDNEEQWMQISQHIHHVTFQLEACSELQRTLILNKHPTILSQLLTLLTCKGYMRKVRAPIWRMVQHLIEKGIKPTSDDMKMIYHEYSNIYNKDGVCVISIHI